MALGGFNCPFCRNYNAKSDKVCARCERYLPPPWAARLIRNSPLGPHPVTTILVGLCALVFFAQVVDAHNVGPLTLGLRGIPVSTLLRFGALTNDVAAQPWTVASSMFTHMGILHLLFNVMALWDLGRRCEDEGGAGLTLAAYLVTGIAGGLASVLWYGDMPYITAGASGAVFGLSGLLLGTFIRAKNPRWKDVLMRTLLFSFVMYFALGTNQAAHLGGLAVGMAMGASRQVAKSARNAPIAWTAASALLLIACLLTIVPSNWTAPWRDYRDAERARLEEASAVDASRPRTTNPV